MEDRRSNKDEAKFQSESQEVRSGSSERDLIDKARDSLDDSPSLRKEKINIVKQRILSGYYDTPEARELLVTKIIHYIKKRLI